MATQFFRATRLIGCLTAGFFFVVTCALFALDDFAVVDFALDALGFGFAL